MALYQGEDIALNFSWEDTTNSQEITKLVVMIYPKYSKDSSDEKTYTWTPSSEGNFVVSNDTYILTIPKEDSKLMSGAYTLEMKVTTENATNIFVEENAFFIEQCRIVDK